MTCDGCSISLAKAFEIFQNDSETKSFLIKHGIRESLVKCNKCGADAYLTADEKWWRCRKRQTKTVNKKVIKSQCDFKQSVRTNTWLQGTKLQLEKSFLFASLYLICNPPHEEFLMEELNMSSGTVCDWSQYVREVLENWCLNESTHSLGGPGKIVEIDEPKFGKRKYNRGRIIDGQWIFGGFERDSKLIFLEKVDDQSASTLLEIINRRIKPGTTIMSHCWKSYDCLAMEGYKHLIVNHSMNFVDADTGAYTQNIERMWRDARGTIPKFGRRDYHMSGYIADFLFRRAHPSHITRMHAFANAVTEFHKDNWHNVQTFEYFFTLKKIMH
ncbi:unnamed protein product [Euphydryas editha]|uniref:ISXO2-like transposase domain-containing protein n=1 Tax=Euphydryas editha TaxID=104508 RepID=A0AAU9UMQ6_EUPED|nr:unnamed protein product [Euphydryas editha]